MLGKTVQDCSVYTLSFDTTVFIIESTRRRVPVEAVLENRGENAYSTVLNISQSTNLQFASLIQKVRPQPPAGLPEAKSGGRNGGVQPRGLAGCTLQPPGAYKSPWPGFSQRFHRIWSGAGLRQRAFKATLVKSVCGRGGGCGGSTTGKGGSEPFPNVGRKVLQPVSLALVRGTRAHTHPPHGCTPAHTPHLPTVHPSGFLKRALLTRTRTGYSPL